MEAPATTALRRAQEALTQATSAKDLATRAVEAGKAMVDAAARDMDAVAAGEEAAGAGLAARIKEAIAAGGDGATKAPGPSDGGKARAAALAALIAARAALEHLSGELADAIRAEAEARVAVQVAVGGTLKAIEADLVGEGMAAFETLTRIRRALQGLEKISFQPGPGHMRFSDQGEMLLQAGDDRDWPPVHRDRYGAMWGAFRAALVTDADAAPPLDWKAAP